MENNLIEAIGNCAIVNFSLNPDIATCIIKFMNCILYVIHSCDQDRMS